MSKDRKETAPADIEILEKATVYRGYFRIDRYRVRHRLHAGGMGAPVTREVFERGHAVSVLPYDPARRELVLLDQFRIGALAAGRDPWLTEIVAGIIDPGETPEQVAHRELKEETGLTAEALEPMLDYLASPGGTSETVRIYLARVNAEGAGGIHGLDHESEDILVKPVPVAEAFDCLARGLYDNAQTVISLQWLMIHENAVRARWGFAPV